MAQGISNIVVDILERVLSASYYGTMYDNSGLYLNRGLQSPNDVINTILAMEKTNRNYPMHSILYSEIYAQLEFLNALTTSGVLGGVGAGLAQLGEGFMGTRQLASYYKNLAYDLALKPAMIRNWNRQLTPRRPDPRLAFRMLQHKTLARAQFNEVLEDDGWSSDWHDKIYDTMTTTPDVHFGFSMFTRGLMSRDALNQVFSKNGWDATQHARLFLALYRIPSLRNLSMMADYVPMPEGWIYYKLQQDGYTDEDALVLSQYLIDKPLREEKRNVTGRVLWDYQISRMSRNDVELALNDLGVFPREHVLLMQWGDMRNADELIDRTLDLIEQKARRNITGFNTKSGLSSAIQALGISVEWANVVAEKLWYQYCYATYTLAISVNNPTLGTTNPVPGVYNYAVGTVITITGVPTPGHTVGYWLVDGVVTGVGETTVTVTIHANHGVECMFDATPP